MSVKYLLSRAASVFAAAVFVFALTGATAIAASQFDGTWMTEDTKGKSFHFTLSPDGKAKGERQDEGLTGTWKAKGDSAVINWDSGWVTKITKQGDKFTKQTFEKGKVSDSPTLPPMLRKCNNTALFADRFVSVRTNSKCFLRIP